MLQLKSIQHLRHTVKTGHVITSIKQSPVLKGHLFLVLSLKMSYEFEHLLRGHLSYKAIFPLSDSPRRPLNTGLAVYVNLIKGRVYRTCVCRTRLRESITQVSILNTLPRCSSIVCVV